MQAKRKGKRKGGLTIALQRMKEKIFFNPVIKVNLKFFNFKIIIIKRLFKVKKLKINKKKKS